MDNRMVMMVTSFMTGVLMATLVIPSSVERHTEKEIHAIKRQMQEIRRDMNRLRIDRAVPRVWATPAPPQIPEDV